MIKSNLRVEYENLENKPHNGVNWYYNGNSYYNENTEPSLIPNSLDTPTLDNCSNKESKETIVRYIKQHTYNKLTNSNHNYWTRRIKCLQKNKFIQEKKSLVETQSIPHQNNEFIELQQQNKNLVVENK